jgi:hypothetical protein
MVVAARVEAVEHILAGMGGMDLIFVVDKVVQEEAVGVISEQQVREKEEILAVEGAAITMRPLILGLPELFV